MDAIKLRANIDDWGQPKIVTIVLRSFKDIRNNQPGSISIEAQKVVEFLYCKCIVCIQIIAEYPLVHFSKVENQ